jgi:hypothetical protein
MITCSVVKIHGFCAEQSITITISKLSKQWQSARDFIDEDRNRVKFTLNDTTSGKNVTRMVTLEDNVATCGCGYLQVHEMPCGCVIYAAEKRCRYRPIS